MLALCAFFMGGVTLLLSLRELPSEVSEKEIVEIQARYARLVLNMPVRKKEEAPPPRVEEKRKKEETGKITIEPAETARLEPEETLPVMKEEKRAEEIVPDLAAMEKKLASRYDIKSDTAAVGLEEDKGLSIKKGPDVPDVGGLSGTRYGTKGSAVAIGDDFDKGPALGGASPKLPDIGAVGGDRYGAGKTTKLATIGAAVGLDDSEARPKTGGRILGAPDVQVGAGRTYGAARMERRIDITDSTPKLPEKETLVASAPKTPDFKAPDLSTKYGAGNTAASKTTGLETGKEEQSPSAAATRKKSLLPETAGIQHLAACIDPAEEGRLKREIISKIDDEGQYCESKSGRFEFTGTEMVTTLNVRFASKTNARLTRCEALRLALQCLTK